MAQSEVENFAMEVLESIDLDKASALSKEIDSRTPSFRESDKQLQCFGEKVVDRLRAHVQENA